MRGDVYRLRANKNAVGHEQQGPRYAVDIQSSDLPLTTTIVAPTSTSAHEFSFRPAVMIGEVRTLVLIDQLRAADNALHIGEYVTHLTVDEIATIARRGPAGRTSARRHRRHRLGSG